MHYLRLGAARRCFLSLALACVVSFSVAPAWAQLRSRVVVSVLPNTDLKDGTLVSAAVLLHNLHTFYGILEQCAATETGTACTRLEVVAQAKDELSWTLTTKLTAIIRTDRETVDCRARTADKACFVRVRVGGTSVGFLDDSAPVPLAFDATSALAPPPEFRLEKTTATNAQDPKLPLRDAAEVWMLFSNFPLRKNLEIRQCMVEEPRRCAVLVVASTGGFGAFRRLEPLYAELGMDHRKFGGSLFRTGTQWIDCRATQCQLEPRVDNVDLPPIPLTFAPGAPVARPTIEVTPSDDLINKQMVAVRGSGFSPDTEIHLNEVMLGRGDEDVFPVKARTGADGRFEASIQVLSDIAQYGNAFGDEVPPMDCDVLATCYIRAEEASGRRNLAEAPLTFLY